MTKARQAFDIALGVIQIAVAVVVMALPETGLRIVFVTLIVLSLFSGIKELVFYFTMARHMVGGKTILYRGLIMLDFGLFSLTMANNVPKSFIVAYLLGIHAFNGIMRIMRAMESKRFGASWRFNMSVGIANICLAGSAVIAGYVLAAPQFVADVYALGLIYAAVGRIVASLRNNSVVFIQI